MQPRTLLSSSVFKGGGGGLEERHIFEASRGKTTKWGDLKERKRKWLKTLNRGWAGAGAHVPLQGVLSTSWEVLVDTTRIKSVAEACFCSSEETSR